MFRIVCGKLLQIFFHEMRLELQLKSGPKKATYGLLSRNLFYSKMWLESAMCHRRNYVR